MSQIRYWEEYEQGTGRLLRRVPYEVSDAQFQAEADEVATRSDLLDRGRQALANWASLTAAQKDTVLKALLRYVLWKEGG